MVRALELIIALATFGAVGFAAASCGVLLRTLLRKQRRRAAACAIAEWLRPTVYRCSSCGRRYADGDRFNLIRQTVCTPDGSMWPAVTVYWCTGCPEPALAQFIEAKHNIEKAVRQQAAATGPGPYRQLVKIELRVVDVVPVRVPDEKTEVHRV